MIPLVPQQFETAGLRILFDVSFFIIITTIGLNIVFGIIVDTFSELRNERVRCMPGEVNSSPLSSLYNYTYMYLSSCTISVYDR